MPDRKIRKVAFIGLGRMGAHMARNIQEAGFELTVHNRTADKMQPLVARGARAASSPRDAAAGADVVITCLMDDQSMLDNLTGQEGILAGLKPGGIHIGTATVSPAAATRFHAMHQTHGSHYIAAPIFGRPDAAEAGTLLTYIAGDPEAISICESLFEAYTREHISMGEDPGLVNSIKLAMNFMLVGMIEIFSEAYAFAAKSGIDLEFTEALIRTVLDHPAPREYTTRIRTRDFEPAAFSLWAGFKDVELMLQAGSQVHAPLPVASVVREKFLNALANGMAEKDWSAIYEITRRNAGLD